jgi:hypothetical protein
VAGVISPEKFLQHERCECRCCAGRCGWEFYDLTGRMAILCCDARLAFAIVSLRLIVRGAVVGHINDIMLKAKRLRTCMSQAT